jgi:hypothetical protein
MINRGAMKNTLMLITLFGLLSTSACRKDATTRLCLESADKYVSASDKRSQESGEALRKAINLCPMACKREPEACEADNRVTVALCELEGKEACERMCNEDKNQAACKKAGSM